jgi:hypothetical protein
MKIHVYERAFLVVGAFMMVAFLGALGFATVLMGIHRRHSLGIPAGLPPLCSHALAFLLGNFTHFDDPLRENEVMFTKGFIPGCLQREKVNPPFNKAAEGVPTIGDFYLGSDHENGSTGYRARELGHLMLHHTCSVVVAQNNAILEGQKPLLPTDSDLYRHCQLGDVFELTKSIMLKPQTFQTNYMSKVRPFFELRNHGKTKPWRFTIADHRMNYINKHGKECSVVIRLNKEEGAYAYQTAANSLKPHTANQIWVMQLEDAEKLLLSELTDQGMNGNILPKRKGQLFFEHSMDPFHCGMRTFFACEAIGNYSKDGEEDGLSLLLKDGLESGSD